MTHFTVDYSKLPEAEKQTKAIADIKSYLGAGKYKQVCAAVHADQKLTYEAFIFQLSMFVGIEGYPAQAWAKELGLEPKPANQT